jgi:hypothetical protein
MRTLIATACAAALLLSSPSRASSPVATLPTEQQFTVTEGVREAQRFEMTAKGTLVVEPDGRVTEVELDMPPSTRELYREAIARWRFRPVVIDGRVVRAKAHFLLAAAGERVPGSEDVKLGIEKVWFVDPPQARPDGSAAPSGNDLKPPRYPMTAAIEGYGAEVDLLVRVDAQGAVVDVGVHALSLGVTEVRRAGRAATFAKHFAAASVQAARAWTFRDPDVLARGSAIVPVAFMPPNRPVDGWQPRIPLEVTPLPWMVTLPDNAVAMTPDGQAPSSTFKLIDDVAGTSVN